MTAPAQVVTNAISSRADAAIRPEPITKILRRPRRSDQRPPRTAVTIEITAYTPVSRKTPSSASLVGQVDRLLEVVEEVEEQQRVAEVHQEAGAPGPREVGVGPRARSRTSARTRAGRTARSPRGPGRGRGCRGVRQRGDHQDAGRREEPDGDASRGRGDARARDHAHRLGDRQPATDGAPLTGGHLVGDGGGDRGQDRVQPDLGHGPGDHHDEHRGRLGEQHHRPRRSGRARRGPRAAAGPCAASYGPRTRRPHGLANTETAAPTPVTSERTASLWSGLIDSACWASSTWIGPKKPDQTPTEISESQTTQTALTGRIGSASAVRSAGSGGLAGDRVGHAWCRISSAYHSKERLGVRTRVS